MNTYFSKKMYDTRVSSRQKRSSISIDVIMVDRDTQERTPLRFNTPMDGGVLVVTSNPHYKTKKIEEVVLVPQGSEYKIPELLTWAYQTKLYHLKPLKN